MDHTICHFEIPVDDMAKATEFYKGLFGWDIQPLGGPDAIICMVKTVPTDERGAPARQGVNGMLIKKQNPQHPFANYVQVENIDEYEKKLVSLGGKVALPKQPVPGMGWFAACTDPEGIEFHLWQRDASAA